MWCSVPCDVWYAKTAVAAVHFSKLRAYKRPPKMQDTKDKAKMNTRSDPKQSHLKDENNSINIANEVV